jgi:hypothetical protein
MTGAGAERSGSRLPVVRRFLSGGSASGPLAAPLTFLAFTTSAIITLYDGTRIRPGPILHIAILVVAALLIRRGWPRVVLLPALTFLLFFLNPAPYGWSAVPGVRAWFALGYTALLLPTVLASLRAGRAGGGSLIRGTLVRSPWVMALGVAPLLGGWASSAYVECGLFDVRRPSPTGAYVPWAYALTGAAVLALTALDIMAGVRIARMRGAMRGASHGEDIALEGVRAARSLAWSLVLDAAAVTAICVTAASWHPLAC